MLQALLPCVLALSAHQERDALPLSWIPADAELVAHLDLSAALETEVGEALLRRAEGLRVDSIDSFADWTRELELEVGRDIRAVTAYSTPPEDAKPIVILSMSSAAERIFDDMPEDADYWVRSVDERRIHSFRTDGQRLYAHVGGAAGGTYPVVFSPELNQLFGALAVIDGERPALPGSSNPLAQRRPRSGAFFFLVTSDVGKLSETGPSSNLLKESTDFAVEAGEQEGEFFVEVRVSGKSEESAGNIADMAQGLIALARLIARNEDTSDEVKEGRLTLLNAIRVSGQGRDILVSFRGQTRKLVAVFEED